MRHVRLYLALVLLLSVAVPVVLAAEEWDGVERVVAIGDVHGDYQQFTTLLKQAGLVDDKENWVGGRTHLVQTGDLPDRGPESRKAMDLLMKLEKQAKKAKGFVHALVGNHEAMNFYGDLRYVHEGEFEAFKSPRSDRLLDALFEQDYEAMKQDPPAEGLPAEDVVRRQWDEKHPPGYVEHRQAYAATGKYGRWIARNNIVIRINDMLFLHGGIGPGYADWNIKKINKQAAAEFSDFSKIQGGMLIDDEGPLWYRGLARNPESQEQAHLENVLENYGVKRIVVGHTVTNGTVAPRFGGRVMMIDCGMAEYYGGRQACLLVENDRAFTIHRGEKLEIPTGDEALAPYLEKAAALDPQPSPLAKWLAQLKAAGE